MKPWIKSFALLGRRSLRKLPESIRPQWTGAKTPQVGKQKAALRKGLKMQAYI
jgi:hypothetical protein